jgi:uncharacterized protein (TIGR03000 family)
MYSAVLMLALTAGAETADFGRNRCTGHTGCSSVVSSCSYSAGYATSCHTRTPLFGHRHSCSSSCSSYVAPVYVAPASCSTSCSHGHHGLFSRRHDRCHGTVYCSSSSYGYTGCSTGTVVPGTTVPPVKMMPKGGEPVPPPKETKKVSVAAPATIIVNLPAGARLLVDGAPTTSVSETRTLVTPELEFGSTYVYSMRAELVRDGRTVVQTQDVNVRGGETSTVQFQFPAQGVASR